MSVPNAEMPTTAERPRPFLVRTTGRPAVTCSRTALQFRKLERGIIFSKSTSA